MWEPGDVIRHVVLFRCRPEVGEAELTGIFDELEALKDVIPGILAVSAGRDCSPEGLQAGMTHGFTVDFVDVASRDRYLAHPDHRTVGARLVNAVEGGRGGLVVIDWVSTIDADR